ncbi:GntR family transcriptional regulator [Nocardia sp. BMG51109]|uniref:GntR family transcriptional regulator n=1 Tax=Nocardia sp. BMG51109 TaxID=1056816 RepID=UPI000467810D|nr:GntR family transcriptional regulator [Nocardia sp. BMG51109]
MPSPQHPDPPYRTIAAEIRTRIETGDLRPGDRLPSIRQIAHRWGVAIATATKVTAVLRQEGLVEPKVGAGTVVATRRTVTSRQASPDRMSHQEHLIRRAIRIADTEGLDAVSMRRLAADLGVGPMSLYRHITDKSELLVQMADTAFGELGLPEPEPGEWRANLELIARLHWKLCRRHLWLPRAVSFTRPLLVPTMMAHTEWVLRALDGLGLPVKTCYHEALTLHALVLTSALAVADEAEAEQNTGMTLDRWNAGQQPRAREILRSGRFPLLAAVTQDTAPDLDGLFDYGLARHLDGFAALFTDRPS